MYLYRAINLDDIEEFKKNENIKCSLIRTHLSKPSYESREYYKYCIEENRKNAFDVIIGHVGGKKLKVKMSPWISTSKNFDFVCSEYAVPQAGFYNVMSIRKPIVVIEKDKLLTDPNEIKKIAEENLECDIVIDLSNNNLNKCYGNAFTCESYNSNLPGYDLVKTLNVKYHNRKSFITGFNNYASFAEEVLFFIEIKNEYIKCIISPLLQDVLYGCEVDMKLYSKVIIDNISLINEFFKNIDKYCPNINIKFLKNLYPDAYSGNNLTDDLIKYYNKLSGDNIYEKYNLLKENKRILLESIVTGFNKKFNYNLKFNRLIDEELYVLDFNNPVALSQKLVNDVLIVEKDNELCKYDSASNSYISNNIKISKTDVISLIKTKKK